MNNIFFAYTDIITRESVEPLFLKCQALGIDSTLSARGGYEELSDKLNNYTHYVFGVGQDKSWNIAKNIGKKTINIQHGQYILNTWRGPHADKILCMGNIYVEDGLKNLKPPVELINSGYIRANNILKIKKDTEKVLDVLIILPHVMEHKFLLIIDHLLNIIKSLNGVKYGVKVHPRNTNISAILKENNINIVTSDFYTLLSQSKCCISGPSNCILESSVSNIPCCFLGSHFSDELSVKYFNKCKITYENICYFPSTINDIYNWVLNPITDYKIDPSEYISNKDGDINSTVDSFFNLLDTYK